MAVNVYPSGHCIRTVRVSPFALLTCPQTKLLAFALISSEGPGGNFLIRFFALFRMKEVFNSQLNKNCHFNIEKVLGELPV